jgi:Tfp pilus assembly protein PilX
MMIQVTRETRSDRGSVLIIAVITMLILMVLGVSFAMLARIETSIGFNYKQQAQAEALAEAALDRARDTLRGAATAPDGFTAWLNTNFWGGAQTPAVYAGSNPPYWYRARVDNDCGPPLVPNSIRESGTCAPSTDTNDTAVVTAWAQAGTGRSRVRAILSIDNAWRHVCSDHKADKGGLCNNVDNTNGNPTIQPADPGDPNGPAAWDDLPRPYLGCSWIDPLVHKGTRTDAAQTSACATNAGPYKYGDSQYAARFSASDPRFVVMAQDPNAVGAPAGTPYCGTNTNTGFKYFGYFDCALSTPCPEAVCGSSGLILNRKGCVQATDQRVTGVTADLNSYQPAPCGSHTGMVFVGPQGFTDIGSQAAGYTIYVLDGKIEIFDHTVYATIAVEGDGNNNDCTGGGKDVEMKTRGKVWTGPNSSDTTGWTMPRQYGYPLALLVYDPELADPTPSGTPQGTCLDMGSAGGGPEDRSQIHGLVYSGGYVKFNPFVLDGGVVAWDIDTQSTTSSYSYNYTYGVSLPPPGFPKESGTDVKIVRKSFITCSNYSDESSAATACQ